MASDSLPYYMTIASYSKSEGDPLTLELWDSKKCRIPTHPRTILPVCRIVIVSSENPNPMFPSCIISSDGAITLELDDKSDKSIKDPTEYFDDITDMMAGSIERFSEFHKTTDPQDMLTEWTWNSAACDIYQEDENKGLFNLGKVFLNHIFLFPSAVSTDTAHMRGVDWPVLVGIREPEELQCIYIPTYQLLDRASSPEKVIVSTELPKVRYLPPNDEVYADLEFDGCRVYFFRKDGGSIQIL